jgi:hypothetical protein
MWPTIDRMTLTPSRLSLGDLEKMKPLLLTALIFAGCQGAVAQTSECSTVLKASITLADLSLNRIPESGFQ